MEEEARKEIGMSLGMRERTGRFLDRMLDVFFRLYGLPSPLIRLSSFAFAAHDLFPRYGGDPCR